jgi:hypothetical protein
MIKAIARGQRGRQQIYSQSMPMAALIAQESVTPSRVSRITRLAFREPTIIRAILDRRAPADLISRKLMLAAENSASNPPSLSATPSLQVSRPAQSARNGAVLAGNIQLYQ